MEHSFSLEQKNLASILSAMQPICTKRTTLDATSSILFNTGHKEIILKSTDLEISLQQSCFAQESNIEETRSFLVSGKRFFDLVKELDGDLKFNIQSNQIVLHSGPIQLSLNIKNADEFPPFPERIENLMQIDTALLLEMLNKVAFVIPQNNSNPALNGLLLEITNKEIKMTTTDGHCLAQAISKNYFLSEPKSWLLPRRAVFELKKIIENVNDKSIFLGKCINQLVFSGDSFNFFTKILNEQFPQYEQILNKDGFKKGIINKLSLLKSLRRSACLLSGQFLATKFDFENTNLQMSISNKEIGSLHEQISLEEFNSDEVTIRFYTPYLLNGLQAFEQNKVNFYLNDSNRPIIFESNEKDIDYIYLVMPVSPSYNN